ncbi:MAG TPA: CGNR zinc finger domain-containing protein [Nocardioidaceae bacterium]|nr:CGNR zinc finger domain-containing protein [Nocardioidaceae bacterium]
MHWVTVGDLELPVCIGGHPALDFCNTWAGWGQPPNPHREWLRSYDHFAVWAWHAGLLDEDDAVRLRHSAARATARAKAVLTDARRLRTALHSAVLDPEDGHALGVLTGYARKAALQARLQPARVPRWEIPASTGLELPLLVVARAASEMLTSSSVAAVKACPGDDCGWLFIDRAGRRRWCSMSACGNRAKVAAYARRQRGR